MSDIQRILYGASLAGGADSDASDAFDVSEAPSMPPRAITLAAKITFGGTHSGGATIKVYGSYDGVNFDDEPYAQFLVPTTTSDTRQKSVAVDAAALQAIKTTITNNDGSNALGAIAVWAARSR